MSILYKLVSSSLIEGRNKLGCLSFVSIFILVFVSKVSACPSGALDVNHIKLFFSVVNSEEK